MSLADRPTPEGGLVIADVLIKAPPGAGVRYYNVGLLRQPRDEMYAGMTGPSHDFVFTVRAQVHEPSATSPYAYHLFYATRGRVPDRPFYRVRDRELGAVRVAYRGPGGRFPGTVVTGPDYMGENFGMHGVPTDLPSVRTEYFTAAPGLKFGSAVIPAGFTAPVTVIPRRGYRPGQRLAEAVNTGVLGPSFASPPVFSKGRRPAWAYRQGGKLDLDIRVFNDTVRGHFGEYNVDTKGSTRLYRNGKPAGSADAPGFGVFNVPAGPGRYRLDVEAAPGAPDWQVSTKVSSSWTFRSAQTARPLMAVRYEPKLDNYNRGPARRRFSFPVRVQHQPGSTTARVTSLVVKASFDDGKHWQPIRLRRTGNQWAAELTNPAHGHVSLQSFAKDANGNTVTQTILRAYTLT